MKKLKLIMAGCLAAAGIGMQAQTEAVDTLVYELNDNGVTLTMVQYLADSTLVIPETTVLDGTTYEVTAINMPGKTLLTPNFPDRKKCKKIIVPKTVETITCMGGGMTYMDSIIIAKGSRLKTINSSNAISHCKNLNLPASLKTVAQKAITTTRNVMLEMDSVPENCLYGNSNLENVVFAPNTKYIGESAFYGCSKLTYVQLPESVEEIGSNAFNNCKAMKNVILPESIRIIGDYVFPTTITSISLPASVTSIGTKAFNGAKSVVAYGMEPAALGSNAFATDATITVPIQAYNKYKETEGWKDYTIKMSSFIVDNVIYAPNDGTVRVVGNSIPPLGETLTIPETVEYEGYTYNVTEIADEALSCDAKELIIEAPLTTIGKNHRFTSYYSQSRLTTVKLPNCLREIPDYIFSNCKQLEAIELPDSLRTIGDNAFAFTSLKSITLPDSLKNIGSNAFLGCDIKEIILPKTLESIGAYAFCGCDIEEIKLPESLKSIGAHSFNGCRIKEITLPAGLEYLGHGAFAYTDIENVTIPAATDAHNAFYSCRYLKNIFVDKANENYFDIDGVLYNKIYSSSSGEYMDRLICYPAGREDKTYNVPENTKVILQNAFTGTSNLHSVYANEGMKHVTNYAFTNSSVEYIDLPSSIVSMYFSSFGGNSAKMINLRATTVPERFGLGFSYDAGDYEESLTGYPVILCVPEESAEAYRSITGIESYYNVVTKHVEAAGVHYISENDGEMTAVCATYDADSTLIINDEVKDELQNKYVVKRINDRAFYNKGYNAYDSLKTIAIPATVEHIGIDGMNAPKLKEIRYTAEESPYFTVMDGALFSKDTTVLIKYPSMREVKTYLVPATVDSICQNAMIFRGDYPLENLYILNKSLEFQNGSVLATNATLYARSSYVENILIDYVKDIFKEIVVLSDEEADRLLTDIRGVSADSNSAVADDGCYYTLSGMRVKHPTKGLYIKNGKKVVIK